MFRRELAPREFGLNKIIDEEFVRKLQQNGPRAIRDGLNEVMCLEKEVWDGVEMLSLFTKKMC